MSDLLHLDYDALHALGDVVHLEVNLDSCDHCDDCAHEAAQKPVPGPVSGPVRECNGTCDGLAAQVVAAASPVLRMRLYCWQHNTVHALPLADVEKLVYALGVGERDSSSLGADDPALGREVSKLPAACPVVVVRDWAGDPDLYAEWVEQGVGCREAAEVSTDG